MTATRLESRQTLQGGSAREHLANVLTATDVLTVDNLGNLLIDGHLAETLLAEFGSPLYVISEKTIRANFQRIDRAFRSRWPANVVVLYAIKANCNPAIRAIIHSEGGGGDCFGLGELAITFRGGANPQLIHMNGGNKTPEELEAAVKRGIIVNIDAEEEIELLAEICQRQSCTARVALRLKGAPDVLGTVHSDYMGVENAQLFLLREKWGFTREPAIKLTAKILQHKQLALRGFNIHTPRFTRDPQAFAECNRDFAEIVVAIARATGYTPHMIDIGGGWPRERDPESRSYSMNPNTVEDFAEAVTTTLLNTFNAHKIPIPELRLEPGRFIIGNASVLLGRAGVTKRDCGMVWLNVDFSTNNLVRVESQGSTHHILPASGMDRPYTDSVQVVGPTCADSRMADNWEIPEIQRGEPVALLDAGMYSESISTHLNSIPLPATVLVNGEHVDIIRKRETVEDVFSKVCLPERLRDMD